MLEVHLFITKVVYAQHKIRNFQFKFLHRRIATNYLLSKTGISETQCSLLLAQNKQTLIHLFWECLVTKTFGGKINCFLVSIHLIPAAHVLDICECLGFRRLEKGDILVSHCWSSQGIIFIAVNLRT